MWTDNGSDDRRNYDTVLSISRGVHSKRRCRYHRVPSPVFNLRKKNVSEIYNRRENEGIFELLINNRVVDGKQRFKNYFRVTREMFAYILNRTEKDLTTISCDRVKSPITATEKLYYYICTVLIIRSAIDSSKSSRSIAQNLLRWRVALRGKTMRMLFQRNKWMT